MTTRSPFFTPRDFRPLAKRLTICANRPYVTTRSDPSSPKKMNAALFLLPLVKWRSKALEVILHLPPRNHLKVG